MERTYAMWATRMNTRGSRGNDLSLERYLRNEYRGGMIVAELDGGRSGPKQHGNGTDDGKDGTIARLVKAVLLNLPRVKAVPAEPAA